MRNNSLLGKVFKSNCSLIIVSMSVILSATCIFICNWQKSEIERAQVQALEKYVWELNGAMSNGIQKSKNILTWPYLIDSLSSDASDNYERLERLSNIKMFMDNVTNDNATEFIIYTENQSMFRSQYVEEASRLHDYENIKANVMRMNGIYWEDEIYTEESGRHYFKFYTGSVYGTNNCIMECHIFFPKQDAQYSINVKNYSAPRGKDEIRRDVNGVFVAVLASNTETLHNTISNTVMIFILFAIIFIGTILAINYKSIHDLFRGMISLISGLREEELLLDGNMLVTDDDTEETAVIKRTIDMLLDKVRDITEQQHILENEKRILEIHMLRKQLDPHMLYNSLSVIKLNADMRGDTDTICLIDNMIDYYRAVLNKGDTYVTISEEIRTIEKFLRVNENAQAQHMDLYYELSSELENFKIPSMLLHTFVENTVVHGFCGNEQSCRISIICRSEGSDLVITIEDNGYGIPPEKLSALNSLESSGYGVRNAYKRMQIAFGEGVSLHFDSKPNKYTQVEIRLSDVI